MEAKIYRSKIDKWLVVVLASSTLLCLFVTVLAILDEGAAIAPLALLILLLGVGVPVWMFVTTSYRFTETHLLVRAGPFRWRIPLNEITKIKPSRDLLSSPALSLDRLRIDYGRRFILISPLEKEEFLQDLGTRMSKETPIKLPV